MILRSCFHKKPITYLNLRNDDHFIIPLSAHYNDFGFRTFNYFFTKFANTFLLNILDKNFIEFKRISRKNVNDNFLIFINLFERFDINCN